MALRRPCHTKCPSVAKRSLPSPERSPVLVRHEPAGILRLDELSRHPAEQPLPHAAVAIGSGDYEIGTEFHPRLLEGGGQSGGVAGHHIACDFDAVACIQSRASRKLGLATAKSPSSTAQTMTALAAFRKGRASATARRASRVSFQPTTIRSAAMRLTPEPTSSNGRPSDSTTVAGSGSRIMPSRSAGLEPIT